MKGTSGTLLGIVGLAVAYVAAAHVSALLKIPPGGISAFWPPAGIALAAVLLYGPRILPGLFLGAAFFDFQHFDGLLPAGELGRAIGLSIATATGKVAQAYAAWWLLRRAKLETTTLGTGAEVARFLLLAAAVGSLVSPTFGSSALAATGIIAGNLVPGVWLTWWAGDCLGVLLIAPIAQLCARRPEAWRSRRVRTVLLPALFASMAAIFFFVRVRDWETQRLRGEFDARAKLVAQALHENALDQLTAVHALTAFFEASERVSREEFQVYAAALLQRFGAIRSVFWALETPAGDLELRSRHYAVPGESPLVLEKPPPGESAVPILYAEPMERSRGLLGRNIAAAQSLGPCLAMLEERDDVCASPPIDWPEGGSAAAERRVVLLQRLPKSTGMPVSYLGAVLDLQAMTLPTVPAEDLRTLAVTLSDRTRSAPAGPLAQHGEPDESYARFAGEAVRWDLPFSYGNRLWQIGVMPTREFVRGSGVGWQSWSVLTLGIIVTALLEALLLVVSGHTERTEQLVSERTAALKRANENLAREVSERTAAQAAAVEAREAAERASVAKSRFLANMSHEIRTPMNAIMGLSELLTASTLSLQQMDLARTIHASANGLLAVLNDILDFSKIEAGKLELRPQPFRLRELVSQTTAIFLHQARVRNIELATEVEKGTPDTIVADSLRLRQVLLNLIGNAIKFTENGRVFLSIRATEKDDDRARLRFEVHDTGPGIPEERRDSLFKPFSQVDDSLQRRRVGTGLGLAISAELVRLMKGEIGVLPGVTEGSIFWFEVPVERTRVSSASSEGNTPPPGTRAGFKKLRLLLVEDNALNQKVATLMLQRLGIAKIDIAEDGRRAVDMTAANEYDLVFMDCQMPVMDGFEATRVIRLREDETGHRTPIVAMTANAMEGDREACLAAGMDDFVSKPISLQAVERALARHARNQTVTALSDEDSPLRPPAKPE